MSGIPFRGVSAGQDNRFTDKERKLLKSMKFPKEYSLKIDVSKINWEIMKEWTAQRVTQLLGMEDEVLIGYIHEQIGADKKDLDPKLLQIGLTGFLEKNTSLFVKELWTLLASASEQASGIPKKILDDKAEELRIKNEAQKAIQERLDLEKAKKEAARKEAAEKAKAEGDKVPKDKATENGASGRERQPERPREGRDADRGPRDRERDRDRDRPAGRSDRDSERARDYDRRRGPSPGRSSRPIRDDRDRAYNNRDRGSDRDRDYDRERGHDRNRDRGYDRDRERGHERGPARDGRERSPVLKKARYGRSRSPGRPSLGADKNAKDRPSSRSPRRNEREGSKRELKDLHSTFAKAEAETVLPDKAEHLILPPQREDRAYPEPASAAPVRDGADHDMADADPDRASHEGADPDQKHKKDKKQKKEKKEKKKHKKEKKEKRSKHQDNDGSSGEDNAATKEEQQRIEDELRQKALLSARKPDSSDND